MAELVCHDDYDYLKDDGLLPLPLLLFTESTLSLAVLEAVGRIKLRILGVNPFPLDLGLSPTPPPLKLELTV